MKQNHQKSWAMAYCGIVAALCVALMLLGAVIPIAMFIAPALAGFLIATVCVECGRTMALTAYAAVSLLALLMIEVLLAAQTRRGQALAGVVLGIALWFDCVVRLNGKTVLYMALLAHVIGLAQNRVRGRKLLVHLLPYLVAGALWMIGCMLFPQATSNTKDIASGPNRMIVQNMGYYEMIMGQWFNAMLPYGLFMLTDAAVSYTHLTLPTN